MPNIALACSKSADKSVKKEISHSMKKSQKSCCNQTNGAENHDKGCAGKCEQSCCTCAATSTSSAFTLVSEVIFKNSITHYFSKDRTNFFYISKAVSNGFLSIWLIPKIG